MLGTQWALGKTHQQEGPQGGNVRAFPVGTAVCGLFVCRLNFTLSHLDVTCEAYDHFRACLRQLEQLRDGQLRFAVEPVEATFPQRLEYERIRQLVGALAGHGWVSTVLSLVKLVMGSPLLLRHCVQGGAGGQQVNRPSQRSLSL